MKKIIAMLFISLMLVLTLPAQSYAREPMKPLPYQTWAAAIWWIAPGSMLLMCLYQVYLDGWHKYGLEEQTFEDEAPAVLDKLQRQP